jgi:hypothetical protein
MFLLEHKIYLLESRNVTLKQHLLLLVQQLQSIQNNEILLKKRIEELRTEIDLINGNSSKR